MKLSFVVALIFFMLPMFSETISLKADMMTGKSGEKSDEARLSGNAFIKTETMEIAADEIFLSGEDFRYIEATGNVVGRSNKNSMDFKCGSLKFDRTTEVANLEDSVHLVDAKNDMVADAQMIEYDQKNDIAVLQLNVKMKQKDNVCTSAYAVYRKKSQLLEMSGNPKVVQGNDSFRAQEITLNLDTQEITLDGRVRGSVTDSGEKDGKDGKSKGKTGDKNDTGTGGDKPKR